VEVCNISASLFMLFWSFSAINTGFLIEK